jgi:hypothetical protein
VPSVRIEVLQTLGSIVEFFEADLFRSAKSTLSWESISVLVLDVLAKEAHNMKIQAMKVIV